MSRDGRLIVLFEDAMWPRLRPLTELLPVPALAFGGSDLATRARAAVARRDAEVRLLAIEARTIAMAAWREAPAIEAPRGATGEVICLNAAALPGEWLDRALAAPAPCLWMAGGRIAGARASLAAIAPALGSGPGFEAHLRQAALPKTEVGAGLLDGPWSLVAANPDALAEDLASAPARIEGEVDPRAALIAPERIAVARGARVEALAVLDARPGPIRLAPGVVVAPHTVVTGPCAVGPGTHLLGGAIGGSTIGPGCRLAGEVDASIWQGWSNKRHHGFVGHSAIGEWSNLGALTTTSDLKNNYGPVRVWCDGREVDTGQMKIGSFIGHGVRTGIGTLLPTGASIGSGSNLFGGGRFAPKHVAPFVWWDGVGAEEHRLEKFLATARTAMGRRDLVLSPGEEAGLRALFESTASERAATIAAARA